MRRWLCWLLVLLAALVARRAPAQTCASPLTIPASGGVFSGTTAGASAVTLSCASSTAAAPEAVYTWTPAVSGTAVLTTAHSDFDTVLAVETQCGVAASTLAGGCGDDGQPCCADCNSLTAQWDSRVTPTVTAGVPLFVIVDGYGTAAHGAYRLVVTPPLGSTTTLPACGTTTSTATTTTVTTTSTSTSTVTTTSTTTTTGATTTSTTTTTVTTTSTTTSTTAPPGTCANPRTLPAAGGVVSGTTSGTSFQAGSCGSSNASPEQVYQWVPSSSGQTTIQTCGPGTAYDTVVYVRQGTCTGSELAFPNGCNDDACANVSGLIRASRVAPTVTSGQTYFIIVDGYGGAMGAYTLSVSTPGAVTTTTTTVVTTTSTSTTTTSTSTSTVTTSSTTTTTVTTTSTTTTTLSAAACSSPTVIPAAGGTFSGMTSGANTLTTPCDAATGPEVVFQWMPSVSGVAILQTCGNATNFDTVLSLRTSPCASGTTVASGCNNDTCVCGSTCVGNLASKITPTVTAGVTYYAIVDGHNGASGTYTLTVQAPPPPTTTTVLTTTTTTGASTTTLPPLTLTGFVPGIGQGSDVIVDGTTHRAYVASQQFGLSIVDVTTPASPVMVGAANPPFYGFRVARIGTRAVVAAAGSGLRVVDLTDETHPHTVGTLAGAYSAVAMKDASTAYATSNGVFQVINVGVTPPVVTTSLNLTVAGDFKLVGGLVYAASTIAGQGALKIVNPATTPPTLLGQVGGMPNSFALDVAVSGTTAYVALLSGGIQVVNVADTAHPTLGTVLGQSASALVASGSRLYSVDGSLLKLIDISTPGTPTLIGSGAAYAAQRLAVDGATGYLTAGSAISGGLSIQTVSGSAPVLLTNFHQASNDQGVAVVGSLALNAGGAGGLQAVDVTSAASPTRQGTYGTCMGGAALVGTTAYSGDCGVFKVISFADANNPSLLGSVPSVPVGGMAVVGSLVYVAAGTGGLKIINVATPGTPVVSSTTPLPGISLDVAVSGTTAYVAANSSIQVVNVTDPTAPIVLSPVSTSATALSLQGARLYAVNGNALKILSISTPTAPTILNAGAVYDGVQGVLADPTRPNVIYLAGTALNHGDNPPGIYEGIVALNVANPAAPVQLGTNLVTPGSVKKLAFANGLIYASDSAGIIDVVTP